MRHLGERHPEDHQDHQQIEIRSTTQAATWLENETPSFLAIR